MVQLALVMFIRKIHQKIKIDCGNVKPDEFTLSAYVKTLKQKVVSNEPSNAKNQKVKTFSNDQSEKENNFISLLNLIADPIVIVDGKGNFLFMNTAFERETGTISKDWIGQCFLGLPNFPETSRSVQPPIRRA